MGGGLLLAKEPVWKSSGVHIVRVGVDGHHRGPRCGGSRRRREPRESRWSPRRNCSHKLPSYNLLEGIGLFVCLTPTGHGTRTFHLARTPCFDRAGHSNRTESVDNRRAQRRHVLRRHTRSQASTSRGRLISSVDLFSRASRGNTLKPSK